MEKFKKTLEDFRNKMKDTKITKDEQGQTIAVGTNPKDTLDSELDMLEQQSVPMSRTSNPLGSLDQLLDITDYDLGQSYEAQKDAERVSAPFKTMMKSPTFNEIASGIKPYAVGEDIQQSFTRPAELDVAKNINKYKNILQKYKQIQDAELQKQSLGVRSEERAADRDLKRQLALLTAGNKPKKQSVGESALDRNFAKSYNDYINEGGAATIDTNLKKMENVLNKLKSGKVSTGGIAGLTPSGKLGGIVNPSLIAAKEELESAIQNTLRPILGGQFAMIEGQQIMQRAFNPSLPVEENIKKVEAEINNLKKRAAIMNQSVEYFEREGTLSGFKGSDVLAGATGDKPLDRNAMIEQIKAKRGK